MPLFEKILRLIWYRNYEEEQGALSDFQPEIRPLSLIGNNTNHTNAAALILGAGVTDGNDLLYLVFLDEPVDHRIQLFKFFSGFKYF